MIRPANDILLDGASLHDAGWSVVGKVSISEPEVKAVLVDIPGGDGSIDLTEAVSGAPRFKDRELEAELFYEGDSFEASMTALRAALAGRRCAMVRADDPGYTWHGRFGLAESEKGRGWGRVKLRATLDPYKSGGVLTATQSASSGAVIPVTPGRGQVVPQITVGAPTDIDAGGVQVRLPGAGTWEVDTIVLGDGSSAVRAYSRTGEAGNRAISSWASSTISSKASQMLAQGFWTSTSSAAAYNVSISYEVKEL